MLNTQLMLEFQNKASISGLTAAPNEQMLNLFSNEEVIAYVFGKGMAPENPLTLIDLLAVTSKYLISVSLTNTKWEYIHLLLSNIAYVGVEITNAKVKLRASTPSTYAFYINNESSELGRVLKFRDDLVNVLGTIK